MLYRHLAWRISRLTWSEDFFFFFFFFSEVLVVGFWGEGFGGRLSDGFCLGRSYGRPCWRGLGLVFGE